jgi:pheromone a factor receptor
MLWASLGCLNYFVNSIIWAHNAINVAPGWCEISIRIIFAGNIGVPAASLCINRRLYHISSLKSARITDMDKRRAVLEDLAIGLVLPLLGIPLGMGKNFYLCRLRLTLCPAYITQGHRFDVFEQFGCMPNVYNSVFAFLFIWVPPLIIGLVSGVYCGESSH